MIFATVGTQLPFERLVSTLDQWAAERDRRDVFAQVGLCQYHPQYIDWQRTLAPPEFSDRLASASVIVAHAGIGSIISALELGKPVVVMPRLAEHGEHRNDHQVATAKRFLDSGMVSVAWDENHLRKLLDELSSLTMSAAIDTQASPYLIERMREFISAESSGR
jgi:UDP-N-acetylglucosamine transferase subunit ALG13